jgi:hypothetical protein
VYSASTVFEQGLVLDFFASQGGNDVPANLTNPIQQVLPGDPFIATQDDLTAYLASGKSTEGVRFFQNLEDLGANYSERVIARLTVPTSGWYRFWVNANNAAAFKIQASDSAGATTAGWNSAKGNGTGPMARCQSGSGSPLPSRR